MPCLEEARPPEICALDPPRSAATVDPHKPPLPVRAAPLAVLLGSRPALTAASRAALSPPVGERERGTRHQLARERKRRLRWCAAVGDREESGAVTE